MADYTYDLYETPEEGLEVLIRRPDMGGFNVTIPYKQTVIPFCDDLTPAARAIGSVNTLYRDASGRLIGDNTDYFGFSYMARRAGIRFAALGGACLQAPAENRDKKDIDCFHVFTY